MRFCLAAVLCLVLASPCWAAPFKGFDPNANDVYSSPEVVAARQRARADVYAAQTIANQQRDDSTEREQTFRTGMVIGGVIVCAMILGYAITRRQGHIPNPGIPTPKLP